MIGTPSHVAGQIEGQTIDRRTDISRPASFLPDHGSKPFQGHRLGRQKIIQDDPVWPSKLMQIPSELDRVARARQGADHRYQTARSPKHWRALPSARGAGRSPSARAQRPAARRRRNLGRREGQRRSRRPSRSTSDGFRPACSSTWRKAGGGTRGKKNQRLVARVARPSIQNRTTPDSSW